ncbi:MAG: TrmB family transcriptional regulator [Candidatus Aenigmarchaeota archaeon]|nr:TrmB family transcriptional regulator [Candidatus Aenigmarchaeota archaeon]
MLASTDVLDALKSIGLNLYERKIFIALLAKGVSTAGELSQIANVPRSRSYDILESLAEKGFVVAQPSKPIKYVALAPKDALERTKGNLTNKHEEMMARIDKLSDSSLVKEMETIYKEGFNMVQPFEMTGTLKGRHSINQHMHSLFKQAKKNIKIMTTEEGLNELYSNHYNVLKRLTKKGIKLQIAAPTGDNTPSKAFAQIADVRNAKSDHRLLVIDADHLMMSLTDGKKVHATQDVVFWANSPHAVKNMAEPVLSGAFRK